RQLGDVGGERCGPVRHAQAPVEVHQLTEVAEHGGGRVGVGLEGGGGGGIGAADRQQLGVDAEEGGGERLRIGLRLAVRCRAGPGARPGDEGGGGGIHRGDRRQVLLRRLCLGQRRRR